MKDCTIAQIANEFRQNIDDNPYVKMQEEKRFLLTVIDLYERYPKHYVKMLLSPKNQSKYSNILAWIETSVKSILVDTENFKYTLNTKLNWIVHGRTAFPKCESEKCNNMIGKLNCRAKYLYNEITFDSSWELAIWIYCKDNGIEIEKATEHYQYFCNGKSHLYFPDFKICGVEVEVKGTQFFAEDGTMTCPYRNKDWTDEEYAEVCAVYKAKHQCMIDNNVKIMRFEDVIPMLNYIKCKYGLSYLKQFKTNKVKYNNDKQ